MTSEPLSLLLAASWSDGLICRVPPILSCVTLAVLRGRPAVCGAFVVHPRCDTMLLRGLSSIAGRAGALAVRSLPATKTFGVVGWKTSGLWREGSSFVCAQ
eukprot:539989-Pelagomonas_calceolata.AAC.1